MNLYTVGKGVMGVVTRLLFRIEVSGKENIPMNEGLILAINHKSNWDVVVVGITCPRKLNFMAKAEMFENKIFGRFFSALGAFPVKRGKGDIGAIKEAMDILNRRHVMLMFPEGKRIRDGRKVKAKTGAVMIANRANVSVLPVCISGNYKLWSKVKVTYGKPISYPKEEYGKISSENLQELSDKLLDTIRSLGV